MLPGERRARTQQAPVPDRGERLPGQVLPQRVRKRIDLSGGLPEQGSRNLNSLTMNPENPRKEGEKKEAGASDRPAQPFWLRQSWQDLSSAGSCLLAEAAEQEADLRAYRQPGHPTAE